MTGLGNWLRAAREARGLNWTDVERSTRIRARYLESLENGDFAALPGGEAQIRGFLRRYAAFLGLSADEAIARYEQKVSGAPAVDANTPAARPAASSPPPSIPLPPTTVPASKPLTPPKSAPRPSARPVSSPSWGGLQLIGVLIVVTLLVFVGIWLLTRPLPQGQPGGGTTSPIPLDTLSMAATSVQVSTARPTPTEEVTPPPPTPTFPVSTAGGVTLTLEALEHVWVRVTADGFVAFEGMLAPGTPQTWNAADQVVVDTGNGAGVVAVVNGQSQGSLGHRGQMSTRAWGPQGELDPG